MNLMQGEINVKRFDFNDYSSGLQNGETSLDRTTMDIYFFTFSMSCRRNSMKLINLEEQINQEMVTGNFSLYKIYCWLRNK